MEVTLLQIKSGRYIHSLTRDELEPVVTASGVSMTLPDLCPFCATKNNWQPYLRNEDKPFLFWWGCHVCFDRDLTHVMIDKNNLPGSGV